MPKHIYSKCVYNGKKTLHTLTSLLIFNLLPLLKKTISH